MFLDIISKIFIFVAIHAMIIFIIKSHIAVIKTSLKYFDFRFIQNLSKKTPTSLSRRWIATAV